VNLIALYKHWAEGGNRFLNRNARRRFEKEKV